MTKKKSLSNLEVLVSIPEVFYNINYVDVNYSVKNSTVDCKYLVFLQDSNQISTKIVNIAHCLKKTIWKVMKNKVDFLTE